MADPLTLVVSSSPGGTLGRYFSGVIAELSERGHRVTLLVPPDYEGAGVPGIGDARALAWPRPRDGRRAAWSFVERAVAEQEPDGLIASFSGDNVLLGVGRRRRVPARLAWHHTPSGQLRLDGGGGLRWQFMRQRKRLVYRLATDLLVATEHVAADIQRTFGGPAAKITREPHAMADPGPQAVDPVPNRVLIVGRFYPSKGHDWLLRALAQVADWVPEVELRLIGEGPGRRPTEAQVAELGLAERCHFVGMVPRDELFEELAAARVAVFPSRDEGFGLVTIEAEAVGTPIVGSDIDPFRDTVGHEAGLLVPLDDEVALADALVRVLVDDELRSRLGAGARRRFVERFDLATRVGPITDTYERLVRARLQ